MKKTFLAWLLLLVPFLSLAQTEAARFDAAMRSNGGKGLSTVDVSAAMKVKWDSVRLKLNASVLSPFGQSLVGDANAAAVQARLGLVPGTDVATQSSFNTLNTLLGNKLNSSALSAFGLSLVGDANAADARTRLGLVIGTNVLAPNGNGSGLTGLTKGQVGLANAENTSDANKPVSTAQQAALDAKLNASELSPFGLLLIGDANASAARTRLGLGPASLLNIAGSTADSSTTTTFNTAQLKQWAATAGLGGQVYFLTDTTSIVPDANGAYKVADVPGLTPGTYTNATIQVGSDGRIRVISNGSAGTTYTPPAQKWGQNLPNFTNLTQRPYPISLGIVSGATTYNSGGSITGVNATGEAVGGAIQLSTSNSTSAVCGVINGLVGNTSGAYVLSNTDTLVVQGRDKLSALPDATEDFEVYLGGTATVGAVSDAVTFRIRQTGGVVEYHTVTRYNGSETTQNFTVADATAFFGWKIIATLNNVRFYINGTLVGSAHTTNIPPNTVRLLLQQSIRKKAGTTPRNIQVSEFWAYYHN